MGVTSNMRPTMEALSCRSQPDRGRLKVTAASMFMLVVLFLGGCAHQPVASDKSPVTVHREDFRVTFTVTRLIDHGSLASVSLPLKLGQKAAVKTDSRSATEEKPALPEFAATLTPTHTPGLYQLVTKVAIREAARNKKGKLKVAKRNQGSLLPIRLGVPETASSDGDPVQIAVKLEAREGWRR